MKAPIEPAQLRIPASALEELDEVERWQPALELPEIVEWVNQVVARFAPEMATTSGRRGTLQFTPRAFRHYQTLGCIDVPERSGHRARYGFRHYLQALLIRKLLWEKVPSERLCDLLAGRSNAEYKKMLLTGIEVVPRDSEILASPGSSESWKRIMLAPGMELHLRERMPRPSAAKIVELIHTFENAIRANLPP